MVLGLRSKTRKSASFQVDYIVHVQDIKPWPPSQSLGSVQSVLLQWQNGEQNSGSLTSYVQDAGIEFNESFTLSLILCQEKKARDKFQKNYLEFYLFEPRKDKAAKGQLLGTATINLADYGIIEESVTISSPLTCKKTSKTSAQPVLVVTVQAFEKESSSSSPYISLSKEASVDKDSSGDLVNGENDIDSDIASFTDDDDDDISSHSSRTVASSNFDAGRTSPSQNIKAEPSGMPSPTLLADSTVPPVTERHEVLRKPDGHVELESSPSSSTNLKQTHSTTDSSSTLISHQDTNGRSRNWLRSPEQTSVTHDTNKEAAIKRNSEENNLPLVKDNPTDRFRMNITPSEPYILEDVDSTSSGNKLVAQMSQTIAKRKSAMRSDTVNISRRPPGAQASNITTGRLKHMKSVQIYDSVNRNGFPGNGQNTEKAKQVQIPEPTARNVKNTSGNDYKDKNNSSAISQVEGKSQIEMLEEELTETAAIEVGLYSVVAEHGSSGSKVHAPARRLSRFYLHACKSRSSAKQASAARASVSGLVLVSKACGNDVPRLSFWLSNAIMLRVIVNQAAAQMQCPGGQQLKKTGHKLDGKVLPKQNVSSSKDEKNEDFNEFNDWGESETFILALERVEAWIFSRIVQSVWWQALTPHMQPSASKNSGRSAGSSGKKTSGSRSGLADQQQGNLSIELWKRAFKDACERLCPIRAGGHECGCLPVLARLVMEQLVSRLDVAMFNAILRESAEEMPTDPVSDPITDTKVLPIPAGKSSFAAGAQLKNAIGNWSRWLTDLFGIEDSDLTEDETRESFKAFKLLNALSDLMMLPFEMLGDTSTRKEVCPSFGPMLIKRVLNNFVPDEFCPDPVPQHVIETLDSEDAEGAPEGYLSSFPCTATPTAYSPPPASSLATFVGECHSQSLQRTGSSVLRKAYTSDDELDELESPLASIITDSFQGGVSTKPDWKPKGGRNIIRYKLLREIWRSDDE